MLEWQRTAGTACTTEPSCSEGSCGKCKSCDPCAVENDKEYNTPRCGKVRVKKTLEKKEVICKVPSYKCVPTCPSCGNCGNSSCGGEGAVAPAPKSEKAAPLPSPVKKAQDPKPAVKKPMEIKDIKSEGAPSKKVRKI